MDAKIEEMTRLLVEAGVPASTRERLLHLAIDYGHTRANEAIDGMGREWREAIRKHLGGADDA